MNTRNDYTVTELPARDKPSRSRDDYVYDIEVKDNHNFFANDILCHNSMYVTSNVIDLLRKKKPDFTEEEYLKYLIAFSETKIVPVIKKGYDELAEYTNSFQKMNMKTESISSLGFWLKAKKYVIKMIAKGDVILKKPQIKTKGLEVVRATTPQAVKATLKQIINMVLHQHELNEIRAVCDAFKKDFMKLPVHDIASPATMNHSGKYDNLPSGTPIHIKGAILLNRYIKDKGLHYKILEDSDKIKFVYLKTPNIFYNSHAISFADKFPPELLPFVDYAKQYESVFFTPVDNMLSYLNQNIRDKRRSLKNVFNKGVLINNNCDIVIEDEDGDDQEEQ